MARSLAIVLGVLCLCFFMSAGYRASYEPRAVTLGPDFQAQILKSEAALNPIPGTNKTFDWRFEDRRKTPFALVQLHGWSATRREVSPLAETLARDQGMNLFMTRLCGHGLGSEAMGNVTAECLLQDAEEAFAVGKKMGQKIILMGTSTGASLAFHLASKYPGDIAAMILLSPNFRPKQLASLLLKGPLGKWIARFGVREHRWQPQTPDQERYWTTAYPAIALHELLDLLSWTNRIDQSQFKMPMIMFYTKADEVLSWELMAEAFEAYGGPKELVEMKGAPHLVAGDAFYPAGTPIVLEKTKAFLNGKLSHENAGTSPKNE